VGFRRFLKKYHVATVIQLGILAYVAAAFQYWRKVCTCLARRAKTSVKRKCASSLKASDPLSCMRSHELIMSLRQVV
jgi:hypothetical protein